MTRLIPRNGDAMRDLFARRVSPQFMYTFGSLIAERMVKMEKTFPPVPNQLADDGTGEWKGIDEKRLG
uniref:Uncharacterized protein n=1 Tax=Pristionchus pacificus TaxID=54126 RepID=A0A2A6BWT0_PRIPA|eukprot:PDM70349.1 hypothetical protein PRIPAC_46595 [Pristionchus pacificus]